MKTPSWFDLPMAVLGALVSGGIVAVINFDYGYLPALTASLKQALYAFVATGLIAEFCRWLALRPIQPVLAAVLAVVIPLAITMTLLFVVHSMKGTPRPVISTIPGAVLSLIGLLLITWQTLSSRRQS
jgi:hypothetical protein